LQTTPQHTLIPTHFFGSERHIDSTVKLRIKLKSKIDSDALFTAIVYTLEKFVSRSTAAGIPLSHIREYVSNGKFVEALLSDISGSVRLEMFTESGPFKTNVRDCVLSLLEDFDISEVDAAIALMKTDRDQNEAKMLHFSNGLAKRWFVELSETSSPTSRFVSSVETEVMEKL